MKWRKVKSQDVIDYLNKRHRYASNIGYSFDWANPNSRFPRFPAPPSR